MTELQWIFDPSPPSGAVQAGIPIAHALGPDVDVGTFVISENDRIVLVIVVISTQKILIGAVSPNAFLDFREFIIILFRPSISEITAESAPLEPIGTHWPPRHQRERRNRPRYCYC